MTGPSSATSLRKVSTLLELDRFEEALREVGRYLATDPHDTRALCLQAQALLGTGALDRALQSAWAATVSDPSAEWPHRLASIALQRLRRNADAVEEAELAVRAAPHLALAHAQLAQARLAHGRDLPAARRAAEDAARLDPHLLGAQLALGAVAAAQNRLADAEAAYRNALRLDPGCAAAHNDLARLHLKRRRSFNPSRLAAAASGFGNALRADPTAQISRRNLDLVLFAAVRRLSYFVFVAAWIGHVLTTGTGVPRGALWVPLALLTLPLAFAAVFVARLDPGPRRHLARSLRQPVLGLPIAVFVVAACLLAAGAAVPSAGNATFNAAAALAFLVRVGLLIYGRNARYVRTGRRR